MLARMPHEFVTVVIGVGVLALNLFPSDAKFFELHTPSLAPTTNGDAVAQLVCAVLWLVIRREIKKAKRMERKSILMDANKRC